MSQPRPAGIRIQRPYDTDEEFIRGDGLAIGRLGMILIGAPKRPPGITIRFEVVLRSGDAVFRGEGRVVAHRVHANGREGLEIRFTRLDSRSKALVEQVLTLRRTGALAPASMHPPSMREEPSGQREVSAPEATDAPGAVVVDGGSSVQTNEVLDSAEFAPIDSAPVPPVVESEPASIESAPSEAAEPQQAAETVEGQASQDAPEEPPLDEDPTPFAPPVMLEQIESAPSGPATEPPQPSAEASAGAEPVEPTGLEPESVEPEEIEPESVEPEEIPAAMSRPATQPPPPPKPARPPASGEVDAVLARLRARSGGFEGPAEAAELLARLRRRVDAS